MTASTGTLSRQWATCRALGQRFLRWSPLPATPEGRLRLTLALTAFMALTSFVVHHVYSCVDTTTLRRWACPVPFPAAEQLGIDFYQGIYSPASTLLAGLGPYYNGNAYPPLVVVLGIPYSFLPYETAYQAHVLVLVLTNLAALWVIVSLGASVFGSAWPNRSVERTVVWTLTAILTFFHTLSYGFLFSMERGNCDAFPLLFSALAVWLLAKRPHQLWLPVTLIALAVHVKIYPAVLFALIVWRFRWRSILPILLTNAGLLLILGVQHLLEFRRLFDRLAAANAAWQGNHSARSFFQTVLQPMGYPPSTVNGLILFCLGLWAIGALVLWRRGFSAANMLRLYALSVPVMNVIPGISHDYKLILLTAPVAVMLLSAMAKFTSVPSWRALSVVVALLLGAYLVSGSYVDTPSRWLANKLPSVLFLQLVVLTGVLMRGVRCPAAAAESVA